MGLEAQTEDLLDCGAVALGAYDAFSYMGGGLKDFLDRVFYPTQGKVTDKPYVAFLTHGGGGKAIASIEGVAQSFKLKKVADSVLVKGRPDDKAVAELSTGRQARSCGRLTADVDRSSHGGRRLSSAFGSPPCAGGEVPGGAERAKTNGG